ncbi:Major capsid protein precursor (GpN) [Escherichia coli]|uniref:Major capsid protein (GpN) n=1 Tax=Escherichia coli TaxID=562 RepID=A0A377AGF4_ECOLX|nr:Major capsid protein precursor (GpN) [Escherichia coli]
MNLVMSDNARNKLGCYMTRQASINNIPVSGLVSRFTVEPSVQQRLKTPQRIAPNLQKKLT